MAIIVALDTTCGQFSICINDDGKEICYYESEVENQQAELLVSTLAAMLKRVNINYSEISAYALTLGPGSFTGIRIGISAVIGLSFANNTQCFGISTLQSLAYDDFTGACALPSGRGLYYVQTFAKGIETAEIALKSEEEIIAQGLPIRGNLGSSKQLPNARNVMKIVLAKLRAGEKLMTDLSPIYVRDADAKKKHS
jgi:tRNA threonylcarbamoyl adenosine modification protein YeaZ